MPNKPEPLFINGRYHFTLSSFDPVKITLRIPHVTEQEVAMGLAGVLMQAGYDGKDEPSDAWVEETFEDIKTYAELKDAVRQRQDEINRSYAEASKQTLCADALAERLEQDIPVALVQRAYDSLLQGYEDQVAHSGLELAQAIRGMGMTDDDFRTMLSHQALTLAKEEAALDAFAEEFALFADETELPGILGLSPAQANELVKDARAHNSFDELLRHAVRCKAARIAESEAEVTYENETPEEAEKRVAEMMAERSNWSFPDEGCCGGCCGGHGEGECCDGHEDGCGCGGHGDCCGGGHEDGECCGGHGDGSCGCGGHDEGATDAGTKYPHLKLV